jgi:putative ABC transport system permease protein
MKLWEAVRIALRAVRVHRLRSALTMLGIIIGVTAVILLVAIGQGVQSSINARWEPLANLITVEKTKGNIPGGGAPKELRDSDIAALDKQSPDIATIIPVTTGDAVAQTQSNKSRTTVTGSTERWLEINSLEIAAGSFFDAAQVRSATRVVVLGSTVATNLFNADTKAALRQTIRINHETFRVIGIMQPGGEPFDSMSVVPLNSARRYVYGGGDTLSQLIMQATHPAAIPTAVDEVTKILDARHKINDPLKRDFYIQSLRGTIQSYLQTLRLLSLFTASVAGISLIVGGIGVLNIMLVAVTERTREIGIRKAIGATPRAILEQFLLESITLTGAGGLIGLGIGLFLSELSARLAPLFGPAFAHYRPAVSITSVVVVLTFSILIGIIAGGYPAFRAARLQPIQALRYQ